MPVKPEYKVTLLGAGGVGKSALTLRVISGVFTPTYNPTIEDYYRHESNVEGIGQCIVEILDTAGTEQFASMRQLYINSAQAFALVYSIDDRASFEEAQDLYRSIMETKSQGQASVILVGNKSDLEDRREVETEEGKRAAKQMQNCPFFETSAKEGINVHEFFSMLVMSLEKRLKNANGVLRRGSKGKGLRRSFRLGRSRRKFRSRSQPDLSHYSTRPTDVSDGRSTIDSDAIPHAVTRNGGKSCVIM